ncbi:MAG: RNA methyltransferase [Deferrisomatales bacterium]|nr:RNA methyltransferase [Deferrisomatales bacterium]
MTRPISSPRNERLRWLRRLLGDRRQRRREGVWVAEGLRLAEEVCAAGGEVFLWAVEESWEAGDERAAALLAAVTGRGDPVVRVQRGVLRELATTETPQGVLAAFAAPRWQLDDLRSARGPVVLLDRLQDPGNLGTIARVAEGAGAAGLALTPGTADPGNPKALRASAGALLRLPVVRVASPPQFLESVGLPVLTTSGAGGTPYDSAPLGRPFVLLLGQEGGGVSTELAAVADARITIPMAGGLESLNVASACAVILYEAARQRRAAGAG